MGVYSQMIFGVILERLVFGTVPSPLSILGTCLILSSGLYVTMIKATEGSDASTDGKIALPEGTLTMQVAAEVTPARSSAQFETPKPNQHKNTCRV